MTKCCNVSLKLASKLHEARSDPNSLPKYQVTFSVFQISRHSNEESIMQVKNIWTTVKNRYRLSPKIQMNFEFSFPKYLIGKCRCTIKNDYEIRTKKVSLSPKGVVFSDTIPLSWFTSSVFIPWEKVRKIDISNTTPSIEGIPNTPVSSALKKQIPDLEHCTLRLNDPAEMTIDFPWSKEFTNYVQGKKL